MTDEEAHTIAREAASCIASPDKKHLRFNEIVRVARDFYPHMRAGLTELIQACDKDCPALYDKAVPMWQSLDQHYRWMLQDRLLTNDARS